MTDPTTTASWLPWAIAAVLLLLLLVVGLTLWWARRRQRAAELEAEYGDLVIDEAEDEADQMLQLRRALGAVRALTGSSGDPMDVPWLVIADAGDQRSLLQGVEEAAGASPISMATGEELRLCRDGVVLHTGHVLRGGARRWLRLLRLLRLLRPQRPLDGLVLALPAALLAGPRAEAAERLANLGIQAGELVAAAQQESGARLPLFLVVTGCEDLDGFAGLVEALPPEQRGEILGWSSPFGPGAVFEPDWVARGMDELEAGLSAVIIDSSLDERPDGDTSAMLLFPCALRDLAAPLTALLSAMLQPSAYHDAYLFRGFYFTGGRMSADSEAPAFVRRLFQDKIFPERRLIQPLGGMLRTQAKTLRRVRWGLVAMLVLALLGLGWVWLAARTNAANIMPLISNIGRDVSLAHQIETRGDVDQGSRDALLREASRDILDSMGQVMVRSVGLLSAPTSYLLHPDETVEAAIATGYNEVVVKEIGHRLTEQAKELLAPPPAIADSAQALRAAVDTADGLAELRANAALYFDLPYSLSTESLRQLADHTLRITLDDQFARRSDLYANALAAARPRATVPSSEQITLALSRRMAGVFAARYTVEPLAAALRRIGDTARGVPPALAPNQTVLSQMRDDLRFVQRSLGGSGYGWLNSNGGTLGEDIETALARMEMQQLLSTDDAAAIRDAGLERRAEARRLVRDMVRDGEMPLLKESDGRLALAADMVALADVLDQTLARPFMGPSQAAGTIADGAQPLVWEPQAVQDMTAAVADYKTFLEQDLLKVPAGMQPLARAAGRERFSGYGRMLVQRAARPTGLSRNPDDAATFNEIKGFAQVGATIAELRAALFRLGHAELAQALDGIAGRQARRLLGEMDRTSTVYVSFLPNDPAFTWWDGRVPFAARAYGVTTGPDLAQVLAADRQALSVLATDSAEPLVSYLSGQPADGAPLRRWQEILSALKSYDQRDSVANGLRRLERLVMVELDQMDVDTCGNLPPVDPTEGAYFAERAQIILEGVTARCVVLSQQRLRETYARLRQSFNATLAGRFPFADPALPAAPPADGDDVRRFFIAFNREIGPDGAALARLDPAVARFLAGLAASKEALAPMLADPTLALPLVYEVQAEFRTNSAVDQGGDMVLAWRLDLGNERLTSQDPAGKAVWVAGQPARLALRFARNAPKMPRAEAGGGAVDATTVVWEASGPWALLELLAAHRPPASLLADLPDPAPETIRLEIPLQDNPQRAKGAVPGFDTAVVYLRLRLTAVSRPPGQPELRAKVALPAFPTAAPALLPGEAQPGRSGLAPPLELRP